MSSAGKSSAGGKGKKKKWSKGKMKEKANNAVLVDQVTMDKLVKDVSSYKLITVAVLVERMKINGSAARKVLRELEERGLIKRVLGGSSLTIYTRAAESTVAA